MGQLVSLNQRLIGQLAAPREAVAILSWKWFLSNRTILLCLWMILRIFTASFALQSSYSDIYFTYLDPFMSILLSLFHFDYLALFFLGICSLQLLSLHYYFYLYPDRNLWFLLHEIVHGTMAHFQQLNPQFKLKPFKECAKPRLIVREIGRQMALYRTIRRASFYYSTLPSLPALSIDVRIKIFCLITKMELLITFQWLVLGKNLEKYKETF